MASEIELKKHILDMLRDFMMGEEGKQFTPKSVEVEMEKGPDKPGLDEVLSKASDEYVEEDDGDEHSEPDGDEEDEPKGLKAFLAGRK